MPDEAPSPYHRPLPLTMAQLSALCSAAVFRQAARYARSAHMADRLRIGHSLHARFHGTRGIYSARIDVAGRELSFQCNCPAANPREPCKHVIALGMGWLEEPSSFHDLELTMARLSRLRKAELLTLVRQVARRLPELIPLLDRSRH